MKKLIKFGENYATIYAGNGRAMLKIEANDMPVRLADTLNEEGGLTVTEVSKHNKDYNIRIVYDLPETALLEVVCESITGVYDLDVRVFNARPENAV